MTNIAYTGDIYGKRKTGVFCQECGFESTKWMGQCPGCKAWNSFCEEKVTVGAKSQSGRRAVVAPTSILEVETTDETRFTTGIGELNRVLGGGDSERIPCAGGRRSGYR